MSLPFVSEVGGWDSNSGSPPAGTFFFLPVLLGLLELPT